MSGDTYDVGAGNPLPPHEPTQTTNPTPPPAPAPLATPAPGAPWPLAPVPPTEWPPARAPRQSRLGLFLGGGVAAVTVLYLIVAAVAQTFPFSNAEASPTRTTPPVVHPSTSSPVTRRPASSPSASLSLSPTPSPLPAGVKPLKVLLPYDITDAATQCVEQAKIPWTNPGLVKAMECDAPDMAGGQIFGYQLGSAADYNQAWANYNAWAQFGSSSSENCPPPSAASQGGPSEWSGPRFAQRSGQVLECFTSNSGRVYAWTYPAENAFIVAQPPKSWSFSKLETWWEGNSV